MWVEVKRSLGYGPKIQVGRHSLRSSTSNSVEGEWLGQTELERVRFVREWVQMTSQQRGARGNTWKNRLENWVLQFNLSVMALLDLLKRNQQERQRELQGLSEHRVVSNFAHHNFIVRLNPMAVAGLQAVSMLDSSFMRDSSQTTMPRRHGDPDWSSEQSPDIGGEGERERLGHIAREWVDSGTRGGTRGSSSTSNSLEGEWRGQTELERVRMVREWVQMTSQQRVAHGNTVEEQAGELGALIERGRDGLVVNNDRGQPESVGRRIRRVCGRQVVLDLLKRNELERQRELQGLSEHRVVSNFAHRNRIQVNCYNFYLIFVLICCAPMQLNDAYDQLHILLTNLELELPQYMKGSLFFLSQWQRACESDRSGRDKVRDGGFHSVRERERERDREKGLGFNNKEVGKSERGKSGCQGQESLRRDKVMGGEFHSE
ncbi:hypothetical protein RJ641_008411 [Dillenia turbinata]|uniref:Uncharacterized protein n=1 Tax=Dillenia turbinata TaxID=194707 RepID=A0AAN8VCC1_9MAGN